MIMKGNMKKLWWNIWSRSMSGGKQTTAEKIAGMSPTDLLKHTVKVTDWNKKLLVYAGRFKTTAEIPDILPFEVVDKARNKVRVKVCNIMIVLTIIGSIFMTVSGKRAAERGESVAKMNVDWHKEYNANAKQEAEEAAKK